MKKLIAFLAMIALITLFFSTSAIAQDVADNSKKGNVSLVDDTLTDEALTESGVSLDDVKPAAAGQAEMGLHQSLKKKFI